VAADLALLDERCRGRFGGMGAAIAIMPVEHFIVEPDCHAFLP
jgi:hypothetical protein